MEFLKRLILQTKAHLRGLTVSQRAAIGLCVILIIGALGWLMHWSVEPELVALVQQDLTPDELGRIQSRLDDASATYKVVGNRIFVRRDERALWLARLSEQQVLPDDLSVTFESLMKDQSPFLNMDEQQFRRSVALSGELARVLRNFSGVKDARVFIDKTRSRGFGQAPIVPTASISVRMTPGTELDKAKVHAMASLVASSVAGMNVKNVSVVDASTGRAYHAPDLSDPMAFDTLDDRRRKEEYFRHKLLEQFAFIPGLHVGVHAELDPESRKTEKVVYGKPVPVESETESTTEESGGAGTTPGVQPNTGLAVNAGGSARSMEKERSRERLIGEIDKTVEISDQMRNGLLGLSASINVPRSYFVAIFKQTQDGKEPTDADLTTLIQEELKKIKGQALTLMAATDDPTRVQVDWFTDTPPMGVLAAEAAARDDMLGWVKAYGGHAGLGALAIVSMLLMVMMVRKASEGPILPGEEPPPPIFGGGRSRKRRRGQPEDEEPEEILTAGMPIGEAQATGGLLVGHEVDEQSVRSQQLAEQVTELVEDNPTVAANLIKRWVESAR